MNQTRRLEEVGCGDGPVAVVAFDVGRRGYTGSFESFGETETIGGRYLNFAEEFNTGAEAPGGVETTALNVVFEVFIAGHEREYGTGCEERASNGVDNRDVYFPLEVDGEIDVVATDFL